MIKFNDFLSQKYVNELETTLVDSRFPWYYHNYTSPLIQREVNFPETILDTSQFTHVFFQEKKATSSCYDLISDIIHEVEKTLDKKYLHRLYRAKANLIYKHPNYPEGYFNMPHVDMSFEKIESFLYYVNDSDGDTIIFDKTEQDTGVMMIKNRIKPQKGSGILFDSSFYHSSTPPKQSETRIVINFLFLKNE